MNRKSQIWVETAIYTLIGLTIIAILLAVANPQIDKIKDKGIITQAMNALETLDGKISEIEQSTGSVALPQIRISRGKIIINATNDSISFFLDDSSLEFSQIGEDIREGSFIIKTLKHGNKFNVYITRFYNNVDITYAGGDKDSYIEPGATPYKLRMENKGQNTVLNKIVIDLNKI